MVEICRQESCRDREAIRRNTADKTIDLAKCANNPFGQFAIGQPVIRIVILPGPERVRLFLKNGLKPYEVLTSLSRSHKILDDLYMGAEIP